MAVLSETERRLAWSEYMYDSAISNGSLGSLLKTDLRAAIDAMDDFLNTNAGAINTAIPLPARSALSTKQKALLLMYVVARRYNVEV